MTKPTIALVLGDPSGIGPEVAVKVLAEEKTASKLTSLSSLKSMSCVREWM
ncbi:4-hydroxythreonine-4-phosphate dehydrogenase [Vibrio sp. JCM 19236]|nr:4-hydroxythreonine-4-phosphate dehydrogenase [Vibrio sp. JCM 19236]